MLDLVGMVLALLVWAALLVCLTGKQPPKGPAWALLRQRTVQMLPVEAVEKVRIRL